MRSIAPSSFFFRKQERLQLRSFLRVLPTSFLSSMFVSLPPEGEVGGGLLEGFALRLSF